MLVEIDNECDVGYHHTPAGVNVVKASDFLLLHGNGADDPARIHKMVRASRAVASWRAMPVVIYVGGSTADSAHLVQIMISRLPVTCVK